jgi:aminoglycoside phosphotransferase (APT) family kinase protein
MSDNVADYESANPSFRKSDIAGRAGRDFDIVTAQLREIVSAELANGHPVEITNLKLPVGAGSSNETILFDARWPDGEILREHGIVLRVAPSDFQLFMDPRMHDQFRLLNALHERARVKVAKPLLFDDSGEPFGKPFMLMEKLQGRVPISFPPYNAAGFLFDATVAQRRTAWESAIDQLIEVNNTPLDTVAFLAETDGDGSFDEGLTWWHRMAVWGEIDHLPAISGLRNWLEANRPANPPPGLSWGDARIGNMMFGDDYVISGVMDWEQMSLGGALLDLGWWLWFDRFHSETLQLTRLEGGSEVVKRQSLAGRREPLSRFVISNGTKCWPVIKSPSSRHENQRWSCSIHQTTMETTTLPRSKMPGCWVSRSR